MKREFDFDMNTEEGLRAAAENCPQCNGDAVGVCWVQIRRKWRVMCTECGHKAEALDGAALIAAWRNGETNGS
jgi:transcription elongation factor Elf1